MTRDGAFTVALVVCAAITTGLVIRREFFIAPVAPGASAVQEPVLVDNWRSHLAKGVRFGSATAPVQLIEFADFECPFCASLHVNLKALRDRHPSKVALSFVHFPLPGHRFAKPAARAAECAGEQGRFEAMHDRLFESQDQLGVKSWLEFATDSGVPDLKAFEAASKRMSQCREC
jgi:protein-disulfide isomerase